MYCFLWRYGQLYFNEKCQIVEALESDEKQNVVQSQSFFKKKNIGNSLVCAALSKVVAPLTVHFELGFFSDKINLCICKCSIKQISEFKK